MFEEHVFVTFNRDWVLVDSETKLKLYFRNFYHVFGFSLSTSF